MKKLIVALSLTIAALSAFAQASPASHFECTKEIAAVAGTDCAVINLQIETAAAVGPSDAWPGTDRNSSKAFAEWSAVDDLLRDDIATRNMASYRRHIGQLARRGPVTRADAARLVRLSYAVR